MAGGVWTYNLPFRGGLLHGTVIFTGNCLGHETASALWPLSPDIYFLWCKHKHPSCQKLASKESRQTDLLLFLCSLILALTEIYKQLFIYYIENNGSYDWWYFPFQLCSIPMYLGLGIPFISPKLKNSFYSFIQDFGLLGGIMALAEPSGLMHLIYPHCSRFSMAFYPDLYGTYMCILQPWQKGTATLPVSYLHSHCHSHKRTITSIRKCGYVLHQSLLSKWPDRISPDFPGDRHHFGKLPLSCQRASWRFHYPYDLPEAENKINVLPESHNNFKENIIMSEITKESRAERAIACHNKLITAPSL